MLQLSNMTVNLGTENLESSREITTKKIRKLINMSNESQRKQAKPFNRVAVFAEVDESNVRFETYSKEQRAAFSAQVRELKPGKHLHALRCTGH